MISTTLLRWFARARLRGLYGPQPPKDRLALVTLDQYILARARLVTVGEETQSFMLDTRGGFFTSDHGTTLTTNADATHTITSINGDSV